MAHRNKVMRSINGYDSSTCVDIFVRPEGTFGFEEYRRDLEDARGWFPIGHHSERVFSTEVEAYQAARQKIAWLVDVED